MVATLPGRGAKRAGRAFAQVRGREGRDAGSEAERFTDLYRSQHQKIFDFACRRVGPEVAPEIVSETFLVAWRKFSELPEEVVPWLYRVASFEIANHRRRQLRTDQLHSAIALVQRDSHGADSISDLSGDVAAAFDALSAADQEILRLATWERLTMVEGASVLGCSVAAYRMRLHRARLRLGKRVSAAQPASYRELAAPGPRHATAGSAGMTIAGMEVAL
jgi:RNA polymerase sigma-70 factor, ECF subfamily